MQTTSLFAIITSAFCFLGNARHTGCLKKWDQIPTHLRAASGCTHQFGPPAYRLFVSPLTFASRLCFLFALTLLSLTHILSLKNIRILSHSTFIYSFTYYELALNNNDILAFPNLGSPPSQIYLLLILPYMVFTISLQNFGVHSSLLCVHILLLRHLYYRWFWVRVITISPPSSCAFINAPQGVRSTIFPFCACFYAALQVLFSSVGPRRHAVYTEFYTFKTSIRRLKNMLPDSVQTSCKPTSILRSFHSVYLLPNRYHSWTSMKGWFRFQFSFPTKNSIMKRCCLDYFVFTFYYFFLGRYSKRIRSLNFCYIYLISYCIFSSTG